jgi:hypothetical protein
MSGDVPPSSRTQRLIAAAADQASKGDVKPELKELYGQLVESVGAAREAAKTAREKPSPNASRKLWDLDLQIDAIIRRINKILG